MNAADMYEIFAAMLTRKSMDDITGARRTGRADLSSLRLRNDESEREGLQEWAVTHADAVQAILARIPRELLMLLKTNDCLRAVDTALGTPINSFIITAQYCTRAINQQRIRHSSSLLVWLQAQLDTFSMELRLTLISALVAVAEWLRRIRYALTRHQPLVKA
jgi:aarF domain-containing kinase